MGITKSCIKCKQSTSKCTKILPSEKPLSLLYHNFDNTFGAKYPFQCKGGNGILHRILRISLEAKYLPYFFQGNTYLHNIFPRCAFGNEKTTYNMFAINSAETFIHAQLGFQDLKRILHGLYLERKQLDYKKIKLFTQLLQRQ